MSKGFKRILREPKYEYRFEKDMDFANKGNPYGGTYQLNQMAKEGWEPFMLLEWKAMGFKTTMLLRRKMD